MIDLQNFMLKLADATKGGSTHNQGHEDGLRDAGRDDFVRSEIEAVAKDAAGSGQEG